MEYWLLGTVRVDRQQRPMRPGINGGLYKKTKETKEMKPVVYISVESVDEYIQKIKKMGGKFIVPK